MKVYSTGELSMLTGKKQGYLAQILGKGYILKQVPEKFGRAYILTEDQVKILVKHYKPENLDKI